MDGDELAVNVSCSCRNVRFACDKLEAASSGSTSGSGSTVTNLREWRISQPALVRVIDPAAGPSPSPSSSVRLRCYGCESDILAYEPAGGSASDSATVDVSDAAPPASKDGIYSLLLSPSASDPTPSAEGYSELFGLVLPSFDPSASSPSSSVDGDDNNNDDNEQSSTSTSFHELAITRIEQEKRTLEQEISRLRSERESRAKLYIKQADALARIATMAASASKKQRRRSSGNGEPAQKSEKAASPSTIARAAGKARAEGDGPMVVQKGGFDSPELGGSASPPASSRARAGMSPSRSFSAALSPSRASTKPLPLPLDSAPVASTSASASRAEKGDTVVRVEQPQPQSPSMRRSRSPSPSRDARATTAERGSTSTSASAGMQRGNSGSKRPPLDLEADVTAPQARAPAHSSLKNAASSARSPAKAKSIMMSGGGGAWLKLNGPDPTPSASGSVSGKRMSSSLLRSMEDAVDAIERGKAEAKAREADASSASAIFGSLRTASASVEAKGKGKQLPDQQDQRPELAKTRHVSFKEPEIPERREQPYQPPQAQPVMPVQESDDEAVFELDEEVELSSEGEDDTAAAAAAPGESSTKADSSASGTANGSRSLSPTLSPLPPGASSYREQHASLIALLDNARSFVGSLSTVQQPSSSSGSKSLAQSVEAAYSASASKRFVGSRRLDGSGIALPRHADGRLEQDRSGLVSPEVAQSLREQSQKFRNMLAMDLPSHRGRGGRSSRDKQKSTAALLRQGEADAAAAGSDDEITNEEMNRLAPLSNLATSLPIRIGFPPDAPGYWGRRRNGTDANDEDEELGMEQKTSVPTGQEGLFVPRLVHGRYGKHLKRDKRADGSLANTVGGLAILGEEQEPELEEGAEAIPGAEEAQRAQIERMQDESSLAGRSPPGVDKPTNTTAALDASVQSVNVKEETAETLDEEMQRIKAKGGFVPPHLWARRKMAAEELLGTSVHDYK